MEDWSDEQNINFKWQTSLDFADVSSVEVIVAPARSVWDDHFDDNDYPDITACYDLKQMEDGVFTADIPLKINTYHFLFRINNCASELTASCLHNVTYLGNGRKLNYVNVGDPIHILLNNLNSSDVQSGGKPKHVKRETKQEYDEKTPLLGRSRKPSGIRRIFLCCTDD